jgi:hypothetical protein
MYVIMHYKFVLNNIGQEFSFIKKLHICLPIFAIVNLCEGKKNLNIFWTSSTLT